AEPGGGVAGGGPREEETEKVVMKSLPPAPPQVEDSRGHRDALDVEAERASDGYAQVLRDLLLHRDERLPRRLLGRPPPARDHGILRRRRGGPGEHVLAREIPHVLAALARVPRHGRTVDGSEPGADHRAGGGLAPRPLSV